MKPKPEWLRPPWIAVNIVLFSLYTVFDMASFFWLRMVHVWWVIIMYTTTVLFSCRIIFGSVTRIPQINHFVVVASFLIVVHLVMFITYPLGFSFAYQESSRSLCSLFIMVMYRIARGISRLAFNIAKACLHVISVVCFLRRPVSARSTIAGNGMVTIS